MCEFIIIFNCMAALFYFCMSALNLNYLVYPVHSQLIFYMLIHVCRLQNSSSKNEVFASHRSADAEGGRTPQSLRRPGQMDRHRGYFGLVRGGGNNRAVIQGTSEPSNDLGLFQEGSVGTNK